MRTLVIVRVKRWLSCKEPAAGTAAAVPGADSFGSTSAPLVFQRGPSNPHQSLTVAVQGLVFGLHAVQVVESNRHLQHPLESRRVNTLSHATLPVEISFQSLLPVVVLAFVLMG